METRAPVENRNSATAAFLIPVRVRSSLLFIHPRQGLEKQPGLFSLPRQRESLALGAYGNLKFLLIHWDLVSLVGPIRKADG